MLKKTIIFSVSVMLAGVYIVSALTASQTARFFNAPTITHVTQSSAHVSLSGAVLASMSDEEKSRVYFSYIESGKVCIMIYPTPKECLPITTTPGVTDIIIKDLEQDTEYTITYKRDNTIRCITTPCPGNEFESLSVTFKTKKLDGGTVENGVFSKNMRLGNRGENVRALQEALIKKGYLVSSVTGYFGSYTLRAVKKFQKENSLPETGFVGQLTRALLSKDTIVTNNSNNQSDVTEAFEGLVTSFSTGCYADGECSVSVDGKKVITTIGWSQETVGTLRGVPDLGEVEKHIGGRAKVYAKKVEGGYSLYGSKDYYVEILPGKKSETKVSSKMSFFITSKNPGKGADLGGLAGADAYCTTLATNVGSGDKIWKAYLSTVSKDGILGVNARDRIGNGPWYNYNGDLIASDLNELHRVNKLTKQTALTENGEIVFGRGDSVNIHDILTGSNDVGMSVATSTDTTCSNWASGDAGSAYVGHHDRIGINESAPMKSWNSSHLTRGCSLPALRSSGGGGLIYCFAR
jgi:hypothetical protein